MNMKKTLKKLSASIAAVMCCGILMSVPASAAEAAVASETSIVSEAYATDAAYKEAVKIAGIKYNSALAKKVESLVKKKSKTTTTYAKSRSKKFVDKVTARSEALTNGDPAALSKGISLACVSEDMVIYAAAKGEKSIVVMYILGMGMGAYTDGKYEVSFDLANKEKKTEPASAASSENTSTASSMFADTGIEDSTKLSVYKFSSGKENYVLEVMDTEAGKSGSLFNSKGQLVGTYDELTGYMSVKISLSPKASSIKMPEGYKEVEELTFGM